MVEVRVYENKQPDGQKRSLLTTHKYPTRNEAEAAAFALRNHPLFGYKTVIG